MKLFVLLFHYLRIEIFLAFEVMIITLLINIREGQRIYC